MKQSAVIPTSVGVPVAETLSDETLMESYINGVGSALPFIIHRYERELYSYLRRVLGDATLAEDVFQNTFLQVHQKRHMYEIGRTFRPWLYTIATNQAIDAMRRNQKHRSVSLYSQMQGDPQKDSGSFVEQLPGAADDPFDACERKERRELIRLAVDRLAEHLRVVIVLAYYQGLKYKDIADILSIPVGTVKSRLHAAVQRLGESWSQLGIRQDD